MLHIYYGYGRGKTSLLNGSAIRAHGAGLKVGVFRFLKGRESSEDEVLVKLGIEVKKFHSSEKFIIQMNPEEKFKARSEALAGLKYIILNRKKYDVIILDELLDLTTKTVSFISQKELKEFLTYLKEQEVLVSGHECLEELKEMADLVTFLDTEKHYFDKGVKARHGIEY